MSAQALKKQVHHTATRRVRLSATQHVVETVPTSLLVPGDIVVLHTGCVVPADMRIVSLDVDVLLLNQTMLMGESLPREKSVEYEIEQTEHKQQQEQASHLTPHCASASASGGADLSSSWLTRNNLALMGSVVDSGAALAVVCSTGSNTYFGKNAHQLLLPPTPSAFDKGILSVTRVLMCFTFTLLICVVLISGLRTGDWQDALLFAAAVAIGLTPG